MTKDKIEKIIKEEINPALEMHDGYISLESFDENSKNIQIRFGGGCQGCSMTRITLQNGIENYLREEFPDLGEIEDITNHDEGQDPYYEKE